MSAQDSSLVLLVPTRNRAALAHRAVASVLRDSPSSLRVIVSDNSTEEDESRGLRERLNKLGDKRVRLIGPPAPLPMARHWDWALEEALVREPNATHVSILTDRMVFRNNALREVLTILANAPEDVLTYSMDWVDDYDYDKPVTVMLWPWTGKVIWASSRRLLELSSEGRFLPALPRLLNAIVPRKVFVAVRQRFGSLCSSISPDYCFAFRSLTVVQGCRYYDGAPLVHSALDRSNGAAACRGGTSPDLRDFLENLPERLNWATPIPDLVTPANAMFHEYCLVARQAAGRGLPPVPLDRYLRLNAEHVRAIRDERRRTPMLALLKAHGWDEASQPSANPPRGWRAVFTDTTTFRSTVERFADQLVESLLWRLGHPVTKPLWRAAFELLSVGPPHLARFQFRSSEEAVEYLTRVRAIRTKQMHHLNPLVSDS